MAEQTSETTKGIEFIQQIVAKHSKVSSTIQELNYEFPFINNNQCYEIIQGLLQHNTDHELRLDDDHYETEQDSRTSLNDIQDEYFMHYGYAPDNINKIFKWCAHMQYEWKYFEIKAWWPNRPEPKGWWDQHPSKLPTPSTTANTYPELDIAIDTARNNKALWKPLTRFTVHDMVRTITTWVENDINYTKHKSKTVNIFANHQLSGQKMIILSANDVKRIVKDEMLEFMTLKTVNIMFDAFDKWKEADIEAMKSKSAEAIALILFERPLQQLMARIRAGYITGLKFIESLKQKLDGKRYIDVDNTMIIQQETGWKEDDIEQIHLLLFQSMVLNNEKFSDKMQDVIANSNDKDIPNAVMERITQIMNAYGVEQLQYDVKHNKNTKPFNDQVTDIIYDELVSEFDVSIVDEGHMIQRVYNTIARCLAFDYPDKASTNDVFDLEDARDWICSNCGNYNFSKYIEGKINHYLKWCTLCGITQADSITMKIRNEDTFIMVHNDDNNHVNQHTDTDDEYDKTIGNVISFHKLSLLCPNVISDKSNAKCSAMVRLAKELMRYNQY
eukprot:371757_1